MARYSTFLGRRVEVQYRAGDILLPASGTFVADSGRSIFLEQTFESRGQHKHFRWEIPYQYIVKIEAKPDTEMKAAGTRSLVPSGAQEEAAAEQSPEAEHLKAKSAAAAAGGSASVGGGGGGSSLLPIANRPKTA
jgi:hypothetical protein